MGRSEAQRLKEGGIPTVKPSYTMVPREFIEFAPEGHPLQHPRQHLPISRSLIDSIKEKGWLPEHPACVREEGIDKHGRQHLYLVYASRRFNASGPAEQEMRAEGTLPPPHRKDDDRLYVPVIIFQGSYAEALLERVRENADPDKLADSPSVLYHMFAAIKRQGASVEQIAKVAPVGVDIAAVLRWPSLSAKAKDRLDEGDVPLSVIDLLADFPLDEQYPVLLQMIDEGATTPRKSRKLVRRIRNPQQRQLLPVPPRVVDRVVGHITGERDRDSRIAAGVLRWQTGDHTTLAEVAPELLARLVEGAKPPEKPAKGKAAAQGAKG